jgi:cytochrome c biogenesis protein
MSNPRMTLRQSVALVWRTLRSMRTALILLLLLALASVAGSLIPQYPNTPERVAQYRVDHELLGAFVDRAGLFDVFGSWWFVLLTVLLFTSLVACLVPRTRALVRVLRARPVQAREIDAFRHYDEVMVAAPPRVAIAGSSRVLRRRLYRVAADPARPALAADKGVLREVGSLAFHWAFILILAGVIYGKGTGFSGYAVVVEGDTWVDAAANYDGQIRTGRFFSGNHTGTGLTLREFESAFRQTGQPMDFVSRVDLLRPDGSMLRSQEIRVNHPADVNGIRFYQINFGWAPRVTIADRDGVAFDDAVVMDRDVAPEGVVDFAMPWRGVVKLPGSGPRGQDVAVDLELWPDSRALLSLLDGQEPQAMLTSFDPVIRYTVWQGRLTDLSTNTLDTAFMERGATGIVGAERTTDLGSGRLLDEGDRGSGVSMSFPELRQYSVFQVSRDAGVPIVLLAAILILVGLLPALYTSRRKLWVRAEPRGDGSLLAVGGFAAQRRPQFEEEFAKLVKAITAEAGGPRTESPDRSKEAAPAP